VHLLLTDVASWIRLSPLSETERPALTHLVGRLRDGDADVMERVLRELVPVVQRWARRLLGPRHDADDAAQEALTEIATALHRFEGRSSIRTLAHRITLRTVGRFYRRPAARDDHDLDLLEADVPGPESEVAARRQALRLHRHLAVLTEVRRTAFVLCCLEGMTPAEAADVAQCSAVTMRSRLFEARAELTELLAREDARADSLARRAR
jgi:RNA polymerase sigma factor (sigma-70 family)